MGHLASKDIYRDLGAALDGLNTRAPWNETLRAILKELYTAEEAELVARIPAGLTTFQRIREITGSEEGSLRRMLERLAVKGLVMDLEIGGELLYTVSPMIIGVFEYTMMRTDEELDLPRLARLFEEYLLGSDRFFKANRGRVSVMRTIPHVDSVAHDPHVEVLDYEQAHAIVEQARGAAVGICSCRHKKLHLGEKGCGGPLEMCISFGRDVDYAVRRNLARPVSRSELHELLAHAKEMRLVLNADNVRQDVQFLCLCCKCCCTVLNGIRTFGYPHTLVTSRFIASCQETLCTGCGKCAASCPIDAMQMRSEHGVRGAGKPRVDTTFCIGCGVCGLVCGQKAMRLIPRVQRVLLPENTVERVVLQALERGTLQNFLFNNPNLASHRFLRAVVSVFLALPPVKRVIMGKAFRSKFLSRIAS
jgi:Pyruvate/2-oxoacid:ferredoxin oxidoreductase delta subunit